MCWSFVIVNEFQPKMKKLLVWKKAASTMHSSWKTIFERMRTLDRNQTYLDEVYAFGVTVSKKCAYLLELGSTEKQKHHSGTICQQLLTTLVERKSTCATASIPTSLVASVHSNRTNCAEQDSSFFKHVVIPLPVISVKQSTPQNPSVQSSPSTQGPTIIPFVFSVSL